MYDSFDAFEYADYLRRRWRVLAAACGTALVLAVLISLILPKRYTATASLLIEPPANADWRNSTTVSPMYMESLKTYERFAGSETLFARAAEHFHLLAPGTSSESLKRRVLKVSKIRDTRILEINATLPDPSLAQSFAQYMAEETVKMSRGESLAADREFVGDAQKQLEEAQQRLETAQKNWNALTVSAPVESLKSEIDSAVDLQSTLRQQLVDAQANVAEYEQRQNDGQFAREQLQAAKSRAALVDKRLQELGRSIQEKSALLAGRTARRGELQMQLKVAEANFENASARVRDLRAGEGMHSERLRVIDPGVAPQRPSYPNLILNVGIAVFLALLGSIVYLSLAFAYRRRPVGFEAEVSRGMRA